MTSIASEKIQGGSTAGGGWGGDWYWRRHAFSIAIIIITAALLNFIVNPFKLYVFELFPPMEVNAFELKGGFIKDMHPPPEVLIIGSSRVMSIDPEYVTCITGKPCFNMGLPSAKAEDYYASLRYAREDCGAPIDVVIVGFDVEALHPRLPVQPQGKFLPDYAKYFIGEDEGTELLSRKLMMLLSFEQTGESISTIRRALRREIGKPRLDFSPNGQILMADIDAKIEKGAFNLEAKIARRVRRYPERSLGLSTYTALSEWRADCWEKFLDYCRRNGISLFVFITPYHPDLYEVLIPQGAGPLIEKVSNYVEATTEASGTVFRDFSVIESFGGDPALFYDEIHMRPQNYIVLLNALMADELGN